MSGVDDRIVSMKFDNASFERKLGETILSLDKLTAALKFPGAINGLKDVQAASNNVNLSTMAGAVQNISDKFNALTVVAAAAITRVTHMAVDAGIKMAKAFTLDPIKAGFQEFETNMNSIQTILANTDSKGTTLPQVNEALDQLNQYSDKTIYNFSQMARNIGTFTAAGVDLDVSVQAIKGIANVAAVSGSNAEQASTAMYQLSQALAAGSVKLMDWNSVVNAGMGGEVFQKALFETGKKMKTIADVPMSMTFDQWKDAGNSFRLSLEQGWLTGEVLTETLAGFTGDLTEAQILAKGYTQEQAAEILRMGKIASGAATEVKTLTQLIGTVKESVASGWSQSFRTIVGDFEQSKALFTEINDAIGGFVGRSADARNEMLKTWADFGGRTAAIEAFKNIFSAVGDVITMVKEAFREFFPATTAVDLLKITAAFKEFSEKLKMGAENLWQIQAIFRGLFSTVKVVWEVVKGVFGVIRDLFGELSGAGGGAFDAFAKGAVSLAEFNESVLKSGAIPKFFENLSESVRNIVDWIKNLVLGVDDAASALSTRFTNPFERLWESLEGVRNVLDEVWTHISTWFRELGGKLADEMVPGDFNAAVDVVNVGLLGGIAVMLKKFLNGGLKIDLGGGLIDKIKGSFDQLTGTLKAMQADLKAKALLKIAAAVGILTASMVVLSMIDSAGLTKALVAMGVGFGQLVLVMTLMDKFGGAAVKTNAMATSMILMATAMGILSLAIQNLSDLSWEELTKGLAGTAVGLGLMVAALKLMTADKAGMIASGVAMTAMATGMLILAEAVKSFADMSWEEMAQGLTGVAVSLGVITLAMKLMPVGSTLAAGAAMIPLATGLTILAGAVKLFSIMTWEEMGQGLLGIGGALVIVAGAMNLMPLSLPITAAGLVLVAGALNLMAAAVLVMSTMDFADMAQGVGGLGVMLGILVVAMNGMNSALAGAASLVIISGALVVLTGVLKTLGSMSLEEIVIGLGALAGVFLILGGAAVILSSAIPALLGLGGAIALIGGGFALFGGGALLLAKAFALIAKTGKKAAEAVVDIIAVFITARIKIIDALVGAIIEFANEILRAAPVLIKNVKVLLGHILDTIIELVPKIALTIATIITEALKLMREKIPEFVETGFALLLGLLRGIRDNIGEIVTVVADIVIGFIDALTQKVPELVDSVYNLIFTVLTEVAHKIGYAVPTLYFEVAKALIDGLLDGLSQTLPKVLDWFRELPGKILDIIKTLLGIKSPSTEFLKIGVDIITGLFNGLVESVQTVLTWFTELPGRIIGWVGDVTRTLWEKGKNFIGGLLSGIVEKVQDIATFYIELPGKILGWLGDTLTTLKNKGVNLISGLLSGMSERFLTVIEWFGNLPGRILGAVSDMGSVLLDVGKNVMQGLWDGLKSVWNDVTDWLSGLNPANWFNDINPYKGHAVKNLVSTGGAVMQGLWNGMQDGWDEVKGWLKTVDPAESIREPTFDGLNDTFNQIVAQLRDLDEFNPVITPVLDLTRVNAAARDIDSLMRVSAIVPEVSTNSARYIATTAELENPMNAVPAYAGPTQVTFEQNNYSPTALSVGDIYRNTKSQIALAKEELDI